MKNTRHKEKQSTLHKITKPYSRVTSSTPTLNYLISNRIRWVDFYQREHKLDFGLLEIFNQLNKL